MEMGFDYHGALFKILNEKRHGQVSDAQAELVLETWRSEGGRRAAEEIRSQHRRLIGFGLADSVFETRLGGLEGKRIALAVEAASSGGKAQHSRVRDLALRVRHGRGVILDLICRSRKERWENPGFGVQLAEVAVGIANELLAPDMLREVWLPNSPSALYLWHLTFNSDTPPGMKEELPGKWSYRDNDGSHHEWKVEPRPTGEEIAEMRAHRRGDASGAPDMEVTWVSPALERWARPGADDGNVASLEAARSARAGGGGKARPSPAGAATYDDYIKGRSVESEQEAMYYQGLALANLANALRVGKRLDDAAGTWGEIDALLESDGWGSEPVPVLLRAEVASLRASYERTFGRYQRALELTREGLTAARAAAAPDLIETLGVKLAIMLCEGDDPSGSLEALEGAPDSPWKLFTAARASCDLGRLDESERLLSLVEVSEEVRHPRASWALHLLRADIAAGRAEKASALWHYDMAEGIAKGAATCSEVVLVGLSRVLALVTFGDIGKAARLVLGELGVSALSLRHERLTASYEELRLEAVRSTITEVTARQALAAVKDARLRKL